MPLILSNLFLAFLIYGFIGWLYESTIWTICEQGYFSNRGFMMGPICPIYGVVSIADWYLLHEIQSPLSIFLVALIVCSIFEYFTSWILEKMFHARWWDYSNYSFNLNGRISLYSSVLFGLAGLLLVKVVHPAIMRLLNHLPQNTRYIIAICALALFIADLVITIVSINLLNKKVKQIYDAFIKKSDKPFDFLNEHKQELANSIIVKKSRGILMTMENLNVKLKHIELRIIKAFPGLRSTRYDALFEHIRANMKDDKNSKQE